MPRTRTALESFTGFLLAFYCCLCIANTKRRRLTSSQTVLRNGPNNMQRSIWLLAVTVFAIFKRNHVSGFGIHSTGSFHILHTAVSHVSLTMPHFDLLGAYKQTLLSHPLPTKMMTGATLAVCGDAVAQSKDPATDYDRRRASSFAVFDMAYRALQHFAFPIIVAACHGQYLGNWDANHWFEPSQWAAMEQTLASQLGIVPFLYYPAFFALTGAVQGLTPSGAVTRAKDNFLPLMKRNLLFWIPVQFVQFGYIQDDLQIPFLSCCGLAWTFILSVAAGSTKNYTPQKEMEDLHGHNLQQCADDVLDIASDEDILVPGRPANATSY